MRKRVKPASSSFPPASHDFKEMIPTMQWWDVTELLAPALHVIRSITWKWTKIINSFQLMATIDFAAQWLVLCPIFELDPVKDWILPISDIAQATEWYLDRYRTGVIKKPGWDICSQEMIVRWAGYLQIVQSGITSAWRCVNYVYPQCEVRLTVLAEPNFRWLYWSNIMAYSVSMPTCIIRYGSFVPTSAHGHHSNPTTDCHTGSTIMKVCSASSHMNIDCALS